jgi:hypothetical protein
MVSGAYGRSTHQYRRGLLRRAALSRCTPVSTVIAATSPVSALLIVWEKRSALSLISSKTEWTDTISPARSSRLYWMFCSTATMPRLFSRKVVGVSPSAAKRCHVASSNLPTYHITFMCPIWSQCHG